MPTLPIPGLDVLDTSVVSGPRLNQTMFVVDVPLNRLLNLRKTETASLAPVVPTSIVTPVLGPGGQLVSRIDPSLLSRLTQSIKLGPRILAEGDATDVDGRPGCGCTSDEVHCVCTDAELLDALQNAGPNAVVKIAAGEYTLPGGTRRTEGIRLFGVPGATVIDADPAQIGAALTFEAHRLGDGEHQVTMEGLWFRDFDAVLDIVNADGAWTADTLGLVQMTRCRFHQCDSGVSARPTDDQHHLRFVTLTIDDCEFLQCGTPIGVFAGFEFARITHCEFSDCAGGAIGIDFDRKMQDSRAIVRVSGSTFERRREQDFVGPGPGYPDVNWAPAACTITARSALLHDNHVEGLTQTPDGAVVRHHGPAIEGFWVAADVVEVANNIMVNTGSQSPALRIFHPKGRHGIATISGNVFRSDGTEAAHFPDAIGIEIDTATVAHNLVEGYGGSAIRVDGRRCREALVTGNWSYQCAGGQPQTPASAQAVIELTSPVGTYRIADNFITQCAAVGVRVVAAEDGVGGDARIVIAGNNISGQVEIGDANERDAVPGIDIQLTSVEGRPLAGILVESNVVVRQSHDALMGTGVRFTGNAAELGSYVVLNNDLSGTADGLVIEDGIELVRRGNVEPNPSAEG